MKKLIAVIAAGLIGGSMLMAPPAQANSQNDRLFYKIVTQEAPSFKAVSRKQLVKVAKTTCKALRSGVGVLEVVALAEDNGLTSNQAMSLVAGAVVFYCPEQEDNY